MRYIVAMLRLRFQYPVGLPTVGRLILFLAALLLGCVGTFVVVSLITGCSSLLPIQPRILFAALPASDILTVLSRDTAIQSQAQTFTYQPATAFDIPRSGFLNSNIAARPTSIYSSPMGGTNQDSLRHGSKSSEAMMFDIYAPEHELNLLGVDGMECAPTQGNTPQKPTKRIFQ